jgi:hypothetical protein
MRERLSAVARNLLAEPNRPRVVAILLAAAMACSAATVIWLSRGATYYFDDLAWFMLTPELSPSDAFEPHYGHLILTSRLLYGGVLETLGADYVTFRIMLTIVTASMAGLFFVYARRRVGDLAALIPTVLLLFLGTGYVHLVIPTGIPVLAAVALGLAALIALDRGDRRGDIAACLLLCLGALTYSTAIAYLIAAGVSVLIAPRRLYRSWVFAIPLGLYAIWFVSARQAAAGPGEQTDLVNVLHAPQWAFDSLGLVLASLTGIGYDFGGRLTVNVETGRVLAIAALAGLAWHVRRRGISAGLWVALAVPLTYWTMAAAAAGIEGRVPEMSRYVYPGAIAVLLVIVEVFRDIRLPMRALGAVAAVAALGVGMNLVILRDGARFYRVDYTGETRTQLAALDLARGHVDPAFDPTAVEGGSLTLGSAWEAVGLAGEQPTPAYLDASSRYGSPAFSVPELERQSDGLRARADAVLAGALELLLQPAQRPDRQGCRVIRAPIGAAPTARLPLGGAYLRKRDPVTANVSLRRFATGETASVGALSGHWMELEVPTDVAPNPWYVSADARELQLCPL